MFSFVSCFDVLYYWWWLAGEYGLGYCIARWRWWYSPWSSAGAPSTQRSLPPPLFTDRHWCSQFSQITFGCCWTCGIYIMYLFIILFFVACDLLCLCSYCVVVYMYRSDSWHNRSVRNEWRVNFWVPFNLVLKGNRFETISSIWFCLNFQKA